MNEVKRCTRNEYQEFLNVSNEAFGNGASSAWFQKYLANCTPYPSIAKDFEIGNHFICKIDGKIVGGLGAYPMDWAVSDNLGNAAVIKAYGIGQVCCLSEYRNRGVMTETMKRAEEQMRSEGRTLGFLGGDRFRYAHFGYDFGGNNARYHLNKHRFVKNKSASSKLVTRRAGLADWKELDGAYNALPSKIIRGEHIWERHLNQRPDRKWYVGEYENKKAYLSYVSANNIDEIYGGPETAAAMLNDIFERHELENIIVNYPMRNGIADPMARMFYSSASWVDAAPYGLIAVINVEELLDSLSPILDAAKINLCALNETQKNILARRLIGYAHQPLPEGGEGFENIAPLCAWVAAADNI